LSRLVSVASRPPESSLHLSIHTLTDLVFDSALNRNSESFFPTVDGSPCLDQPVLNEIVDIEPMWTVTVNEIGCPLREPFPVPPGEDLERELTRTEPEKVGFKATH
jgi:hypothetical protein